ncbi:MAG TPA: fluoride efflux transporter CrcB [Caulobacterales bacterium]|nr:fluoride efflux transporter CrcB [Caulobacterales bacterium]
MKTPYLAIALGSIVGSLLRWLVGAAALGLIGGAFPWGTWFVNVTGSFAIGFYAAFTEPSADADANFTMRQFVMTGICGGYTTFSLFSLETFRMLRVGALGDAALYAAVSLIGWIAAAWLGEQLAGAVRASAR